MRFLFLFLFCYTTLTYGNAIWGKTGHRVTGYIAEKHLSKKAKKAIDALLDGQSLAFASTYADEIKSDRTYKSFSAWHYVNYPLGITYNQAEKSKYGDIVMAIDSCKSVLTNAKSSRADKVFYLKLLIHFIGDLHQPLHAGRAQDKGGNTLQVQWFKQGTNLHKLWDTNLIESYGMSAFELAQELDRSTSKKQRKALQEGGVLDWLEESHKQAEVIYKSAQVGEKLWYPYSYQYNPLLFSSLKKGGFRLAAILNQIFG